MSSVSLGFDGLLHRLLWDHSYTIVPSRVLYRVLSVCCHTVPAWLLDAVRCLRGKSPRYRKLMMKTSRSLETMSYFGLREWNMVNDNVVRLRTLLSPAEARLLEFDLATVDWNEYFRAYIPGIRRYVLGEPKPSLPRWSALWNRRIHFLCRLLHKLLWILLCLKLGHRLYVVRNLFPILIS
uniref:Fatty acyl-CoA reductase C-terminal domain-containing protein n=1 Tax=Anopheles atroparvus TaxID=41427 RepID=A0AAG5DLI7_ANOAO